MGLKGYRLWGMGQLDSTCRAPPRPVPPPAAAAFAPTMPFLARATTTISPLVPSAATRHPRRRSPLLMMASSIRLLLRM
jgi:hypothetical protein